MGIYILHVIRHNLTASQVHDCPIHPLLLRVVYESGPVNGPSLAYFIQRSIRHKLLHINTIKKCWGFITYFICNAALTTCKICSFRFNIISNVYLAPTSMYVTYYSSWFVSGVHGAANVIENTFPMYVLCFYDDVVVSKVLPYLIRWMRWINANPAGVRVFLRKYLLINGPWVLVVK